MKIRWINNFLVLIMISVVALSCATTKDQEKSVFEARTPSSYPLNCEEESTKRGLPPADFLARLSNQYKGLWTNSWEISSSFPVRILSELKNEPSTELLHIDKLKESFQSDFRFHAKHNEHKGVSHVDVIWFHENLNEALEFAKAEIQTREISDELYKSIRNLTDKYYGPQTQSRHFKAQANCYGLNLASPDYVVSDDEPSSQSGRGILLSARNWVLELYQLMREFGSFRSRYDEEN